MLRSITLRFGAGEGEPGLSFSPGPMTVFVGPNNAGKSLALRELEDFIASGGTTAGHIVAAIEPLLPDASEAEEMVLDRAVEDADDDLPEGWVRIPRIRSPADLPLKRATDLPEPVTEQPVNLHAILAALRHGESRSPDDRALLLRELLRLFTIRLDGQTRLALTQPRLMSDPGGHPSSHLDVLFRDHEARERIREITADALGLYFVIDSTEPPHFRIRMSSRPPNDVEEEQGTDGRARAFHGRAHDIAEVSDGIRAFTGLTAAVMSVDYRVMLVDEPEAFLHPPLTRKLGKRLTQLAAERGANVLAATHSPDFLMGCIHSGARVNIVRLTYRHGVPGARLLAADELAMLMRDPLLRSTGVLGALFHDGAVVCEADADRVFYAEVNERLLAARSGGADGCVFLNAQNKQTIRRIIRPLREMGVPAAAIADLDVLKGKEDFRDLLKAAFVPPVFWVPWEEVRERVQQKLRNEGFKQGGVYELPREVRGPAEELLRTLVQYGVFLVPTGELESWLPELEVGGHGPEWLTGVFERMGTDPRAEGYRGAAAGGVWAFMRTVAEWIEDPRRKGMAEEVVPSDHLLAPPPAEPEPAQASSAAA